MKIYLVSGPTGSESEYAFQATSPERAADLYIAAMLAEEISLDPSTLVDSEGRPQQLEIRCLPAIGEARIGFEEGNISWEEITSFFILPSECPSWQDAAARGYDFLNGEWSEDPAP